MVCEDRAKRIPWLQGFRHLTASGSRTAMVLGFIWADISIPEGRTATRHRQEVHTHNCFTLFMKSAIYIAVSTSHSSLTWTPTCWHALGLQKPMDLHINLARRLPVTVPSKRCTAILRYRWGATRKLTELSRYYIGLTIIMLKYV